MNKAATETIRPLGPISDLACSSRLGGIVNSIRLQSSQDRIESLPVIVKDIEEKLERVEALNLEDLPDREKRIGSLDVRLVIHALRLMGDMTHCGLTNTVQDRAAAIVRDRLGFVSKDPLHDTLALDLQDLLRISPKSDPRGYSDAMRADVLAANARDAVFVIDDMRAGLYAGLVPIVHQDDLARPPVEASGALKKMRIGW